MNRRIAKKILRRPWLLPVKSYPAAALKWAKDRRSHARCVGRWNPIPPELRSFDWELRGIATNALVDHCEDCHGARGGTPGNENIVGGRILCDYCS